MQDSTTPSAEVARAIDLGTVAVSDHVPTPPRRLLVGVDTAAQMLGIGVAKFNELVYKREVVSVKIGGRRLIPVAQLEAWVDELTRGAELAIAAGRVP